MDGRLRQLFQQRLPEFHWQAVETGGTGLGIPDLNFCCTGIEGWIELKQTQAWRVRVSPEQVGWAERRLRHGGRVFVAVRRKDTELYLLTGSAMRALAQGDEKLPALALAFWTGGPHNWDWVDIKSLLLLQK